MPIKKNKDEAEMPEMKSDFLKIILVVLLIAAGFGMAFFYIKYASVNKQLTMLKDPEAQQAQAKAEAQDLMNKVGKLMVLPEGEPAIATVADSEALAKQQVFFKDAKNGDKVLIYKDKAIIYNPTENRIVNVGPVVMSGDQVAAQTSAPTVEVRNGSQKIGAANELADELKKVGVTVATVDNAANADYQATVLVNLTGKDVKPLEDKLQVTATDKLPDGEASSTADVVIILGNKK